jgi:acetyltransferase-like isoleucine patch superfamily enzyme
MTGAIARGMWLVVEKLLRWIVHPRLRARLVSLLGARVGRNVRIYEQQIITLPRGFSTLEIADDVHIGPGCLLDLHAPLSIGARSTLSPGVTVITHSDPGSGHGSRMCEIYPPQAAGVTIGSDCWIGANATLLAGSALGDRVAIGAGSVVRGTIPADSMAAGAPAIVRKKLDFGV